MSALSKFVASPHHQVNHLAQMRLHYRDPVDGLIHRHHVPAYDDGRYVILACQGVSEWCACFPEAPGITSEEAYNDPRQLRAQYLTPDHLTCLKCLAL